MAKTALRRGSQEEGNSDYFTGCPIGGGFIWYGLPTKIPSNCMICDNSTLAIANFAKLHENLGGAWGTSGANLNIPDLRGRFPRGVDGSAGNDPDKATRTAANAGGNSGNNVGSVQTDAIQGHKHMTVGGSGVSGATDFNSNFGGTSSALSSMGGFANQGSYRSIYSGTSDIADAVNGTPRNASETRVKNANVYFVIRVS